MVSGLGGGVWKGRKRGDSVKVGCRMSRTRPFDLEWSIFDFLEAYHFEISATGEVTEREAYSPRQFSDSDIELDEVRADSPDGIVFPIDDLNEGEALPALRRMRPFELAVNDVVTVLDCLGENLLTNYTVVEVCDEERVGLRKANGLDGFTKYAVIQGTRENDGWWIWDVLWEGCGSVMLFMPAKTRRLVH